MCACVLVLVCVSVCSRESGSSPSRQHSGRQHAVTGGTLRSASTHSTQRGVSRQTAREGEGEGEGERERERKEREREREQFSTQRGVQ